MSRLNVVRLQSAGLLSPGAQDRLSDDQKQAIESLSEEEIDALISSKEKLEYQSLEVKDGDSVRIF